MASPIIMSHRKNDTSNLLQQLVKLVREFDEWDASAGQVRSPAVARQVVLKKRQA
jgi:LysR family transcriptional regulator, benzoate and cis,cis-muconate-responsive activator of ben and cat genes